MKYEELPEPIAIGTTENFMGRKFGQLTVLFRVAVESDPRKVYWACHCDCGEYCIKRSDALKNGSSVICDKNNHNNLVGQRFGHLIVVEQLNEFKKGNRWKYRCMCDCGNLTPIYTWQTYLLNGYPQSCGCGNSNIKDITGQRFGMLTVLEPLEERTETNGLIWKCRCDCGRIVEFPSKTLLKGAVSSCKHHNISVGEYNISKVLDKNNIPYKHNKTFKNCVFPDTKARARFDFYFEDKNFFVEFDGTQHFAYTEHDWNTKKQFETTHSHDLFKNQWAWDNSIPMKRIPPSYRDKITLDSIMSNKFLITPQTHPQWYPKENSSYPYS